MVNYGYNHTCKGWKENKKQELAQRLSKELGLPMGYFPGDTPYIEVDGGYLGVRMRRLTHLAKKKLHDLVHQADKIFHEVMECKN